MATSATTAGPPLHPLHAILLGFPIALFAGGLASDITYLNSAEIQWTNFAQWLIAGALFFGGIVLLFAIVRLIRARRHGARGRAGIYLILLAAMWVLGLINAFQHSRDGWSSVGTLGLVLSIVTTLLALAAGWVGYAAGAADRGKAA